MDLRFRPATVVRDEDEIHLRDMGRILARNRLVIASAIVLGVAATGLYNRLTAPVFEARSSVRIFENRASLAVLDLLGTRSAGDGIETAMEELQSRTMFERVVDSLGLRLRVVSPRGVPRGALLDSVTVEPRAPQGRYELVRATDGEFALVVGPDGERRRPAATAVPGVRFRVRSGVEPARIVLEVVGLEEAVERLRRNVLVSRPSRDVGIVAVRHQSQDTVLVHAVPNALVSAFVARSRLARGSAAASTVRFLEEQADTVSRRLEVAEEALTAFREREQIVSVRAEARSQVTQLTRLQAERNVLETERAALQRLLNDIEASAVATEPGQPSPYTRLIAFPTLYRNQVTTELLRSLNEAEAQRSRLLERRTERDPDVINVTRLVRGLETQLRAMATTYLQGLTNQVRAYDETLERFGQELERIPPNEVELARLQRQTDLFAGLYNDLQEQLYESRVLEAVENVNVHVVDPAILPTGPVRPVGALNLLFGMLMGAMAGVMVAFIREHLDHRVHTREHLKRMTGGLPVLGAIPSIGGRRGNAAGARAGSPVSADVRLVGGDARDPASEAYRVLRTNLTFSSPDRKLSSIVVTSPLPGEGKSTTAANLAITLAQQGARVLLVDGDLRRGLLSSWFGVAREPGLTDLLLERADLDGALRQVDLGERGRLHLLTSGSFPPNPAELLGSRKLRLLLESLEERFDMVILDSAPLAVVTDAAVLGRHADGVLLVARASRTTEGALAYALEQLRNVRCEILGAVLTDVDHRRDPTYGAGHVDYARPVAAGAGPGAQGS